MHRGIFSLLTVLTLVLQPLLRIPSVHAAPFLPGADALRPILPASVHRLPATAPNSEIAAVLASAVQVAAGGFHTCAVTSSGGVKCWGSNSAGQLGDGTITDRITPVDVAGLTSGIVAVSAGDYQTCALTTSGGVQCWGRNTYGQLGDGTMVRRLTPVDVVGLTAGVASIVTGSAHSCVVTTDGGMKCWGWNSSGQLGDGTTDDRAIPVDVYGLTSSVSTAFAGWAHTCAVTGSGGLKCWGWNNYRQLGDGTTTDRPTPMDVIGLTSGVADNGAGGFGHTCARMAAGGVKCWGANWSGQLGDGTIVDRPAPVDVVGLLSTVVMVAARESHSCALTTGGGLKCWGNNYSGELGDGSTMGRSAPAEVVGLSSGVTEVACGGGHTCAVTSAGSPKCWGSNSAGQLGDSTYINRLVPVEVIGFGSEALPFDLRLPIIWR